MIDKSHVLVFVVLNMTLIMKTTKLSNVFKNKTRVREEFYNFIRDLK